MASRAVRLLVLAAWSLALLIGGAATAGAEPGNSGAAKACQKGGWTELTRHDGSSFRNTGDCVSYRARGGTFGDGDTGGEPDDCLQSETSGFRIVGPANTWASAEIHSLDVTCSASPTDIGVYVDTSTADPSLLDGAEDPFDRAFNVCLYLIPGASVGSLILESVVGGTTSEFVCWI